MRGVNLEELFLYGIREWEGGGAEVNLNFEKVYNINSLIGRLIQIAILFSTLFLHFFGNFEKI